LTYTLLLIQSLLVMLVPGAQHPSLQASGWGSVRTEISSTWMLEHLQWPTVIRMDSSAYSSSGFGSYSSGSAAGSFGMDWSRSSSISGKRTDDSIVTLPIKSLALSGGLMSQPWSMADEHASSANSASSPRLAADQYASTPHLYFVTAGFSSLSTERTIQSFAVTSDPPSDSGGSGSPGGGIGGELPPGIGGGLGGGSGGLGSPGAVPEPSSLALLMTTGLLAMRRRACRNAK